MIIPSIGPEATTGNRFITPNIFQMTNVIHFQTEGCLRTWFYGPLVGSCMDNYRQDLEMETAVLYIGQQIKNV